MMATVRYCEILHGRFNVNKMCTAAVEAVEAAATTTTMVVVVIYNIRDLSF